jgi:hypothetical protein
LHSHTGSHGSHGSQDWQRLHRRFRERSIRLKSASSGYCTRPDWQQEPQAGCSQPQVASQPQVVSQPQVASQPQAGSGQQDGSQAGSGQHVGSQAEAHCDSQQPELQAWPPDLDIPRNCDSVVGRT